MPATRRSSIARKLTTVNTLISGVALLLACVAFGVYDRNSFRERIVVNLSTQAQIAASNSVSALVFNDRRSAEGTLAALNAAPNIVSGEIYTPDGELFALYQRDQSLAAPGPLAVPVGEVERRDFGDGQIAVLRRILFHGKHVGTIAIRSDLQALNARGEEYVKMGLVVLFASLMAAMLLTRLSQRVLSRPIEHLAQTVRHVTVDKDFSVRAELAPNVAYEIAVLSDAFNEMLSEIQQRDASLRNAQLELEDRVRLRTAELDSANKELEAFSYSVSHDLRSPLRHVTGFATLLEAQCKDSIDDQGRKYLHTITESAKRMGRLIDDLLAFSRMGRGQIIRRKVNLNELVRDARQEVLSENGASPNITWQIADLPDVEGDPAMLRLAIVNLLSNAVKYSSPQKAPRIEIGTSTGESSESVVYVRDNGVGFDPQYAHKLFGVFQRLHSADEFDGTGIGLANVRRIVQRHGGRVWAEGRVGEGATFYVGLPAKGQT
jgi:signal transduction histidine kinase